MDGPPDLRIVQANERTLLAWVRTGLGIMAFGFVVARLGLWLDTLHPEAHEGDDSVGFGVLLVLLGAATLGIGAARFVRAHRAIVSGMAHLPGTLPGVLLTGALAAGGVGLAAYLVLR